ncbi:hypothetical protein BHM03_00033332, partial [Ensete ventricosum]
FCEKNTTVINLTQVEVPLIIRALSQKFKILSIPNIFDYGKSYEHGFTKIQNVHKLCSNLRFDQFFVYYLRNSKYFPFSTY